jgi:flagellar transcriptional activator FlhD
LKRICSRRWGKRYGQKWRRDEVCRGTGIPSIRRITRKMFTSARSSSSNAERRRLALLAGLDTGIGGRRAWRDRAWCVNVSGRLAACPGERVFRLTTRGVLGELSEKAMKQTCRSLMEIRDINLSYLLLAQSMLREDREAAMHGLGVNAEVAGVLADLTPEQCIALSASTQLICRFRFVDHEIFASLSGEQAYSSGLEPADIEARDRAEIQ